MIWFACKQCGKVHGRSEGSSGTTVFCECGQGNMVPWESTAQQPEKPPEIPAASPGAAPRLKPIVFEPAAVPPPRPVPPRERDRVPPEPRMEPRTEGRSEGRAPEPGRRDRRGPRDPNACLNHDHKVKQNSCVDCGEGFCATCLVTFQGKMLCGPCKNFRIKLLQKPLQIATFAWLSVALSLVMALLILILPIGRSPLSIPSILWALLALAPQVGAVVLGILAWKQVEKDAGLGGRSLALTGMVTAGLMAVFILVLNLYGARWGS